LPEPGKWVLGDGVLWHWPGGLGWGRDVRLCSRLQAYKICRLGSTWVDFLELVDVQVPRMQRIGIHVVQFHVGRRRESLHSEVPLVSAAHFTPHHWKPFHQSCANVSHTELGFAGVLIILLLLVKLSLSHDPGGFFP
jgi:hypothetical protein